MKNFLALLSCIFLHGSSASSCTGIKQFKDPDAHQVKPQVQNLRKISYQNPCLQPFFLKSQEKGDSPQQKDNIPPKTGSLKFILYKDLTPHFWNTNLITHLGLVVDPTQGFTLQKPHGESFPTKTINFPYMTKLFRGLQRCKNLKTLEIIFSTKKRINYDVSFIRTNEDGEPEQKTENAIKQWARHLAALSYLEKFSLSTGMEIDGEALLNCDMGTFIGFFMVELVTCHRAFLEKLFLFPISPRFVQKILSKLPNLEKISGTSNFGGQFFPDILSGTPSNLNFDFQLNLPIEPKNPIEHLYFQQPLTSLLDQQFVIIFEDTLRTFISTAFQTKRKLLSNILGGESSALWNVFIKMFQIKTQFSSYLALKEQKIQESLKT